MGTTRLVAMLPARRGMDLTGDGDGALAVASPAEVRKKTLGSRVGVRWPAS
jgi:hypothetical protein